MERKSPKTLSKQVIADHKKAMQNIVDSLVNMADEIKSSDASPAEKTEAMSRLRAFLSLRITNTILGSSIDEANDVLK